MDVPDAVSAVGEEAVRLARESRLLVVGAGGIGCELLKTLVLSGYERIEVIDLDTIETSNLNRQFLFRQHHVGQPKSRIAAAAARQMNPAASITDIQGSIMSDEFDVAWFKRFTLVLNALDNIPARAHVNRMCLASGVPLIESGTMGYHGQALVIVKGKTECYECYPKAVATKQFATCTIRSTPSLPVHCVVWAKHVFNLLFGEPDDRDEVSQLPKIDEARERVAEFTETIATHLYVRDIETLLAMDKLWKGRAKPTPMDAAMIADGVRAAEAGRASGEPRAPLPFDRAWTATECLDAMLASLSALVDRPRPLVFDKDDKDAVDFVTACANLRALCFAIPTKSRFDVKAMASNIIAAIATTNAIVAGLIVALATRLLSESLEVCRRTYVSSVNTSGRVVYPTRLDKPNASCFVCSRGTAVVEMDVGTTTVGELVDGALKALLHFVQPEFSVGSRVVYESDMTAQRGKLLEAVGVRDGTILDVTDFVQENKCRVLIAHRAAAPPPEDADRDTDESVPPPKFSVLSGANAAARTNGDDTRGVKRVAPSADGGDAGDNAADAGDASVDQPARRVRA